MSQRNNADDQVSERIANALLGGDNSVLQRLFAEIGQQTPVCIWSPDREAVPDGPLRFLLDYWSGLRVEDRLPNQDAIDPVQMKPALGKIMLLDVVVGGLDYRYRLYGSDISRHIDRDLTGTLTSELDFPLFANYFIGNYRAVLAKRMPLYSEHQPPVNVNVKYWHRLVLPLADEAQEISRLLIGNVAGPRKDL